jgi:tetratricopeptide (TPR) repeat protein
MVNANEREIERLSRELSEHYHKPDLIRAAEVAAQLETLLGEPTPESLRWYVHDWILIHEARGNLQEAIRLQNLDIERKRKEIDAGDYDPYPHLIPGEIEYLQDSFYLQALRYERLGRTQDAIDCLLAILSLAKTYGIGPDEDSRALYARLTGGIE